MREKRPIDHRRDATRARVDARVTGRRALAPRAGANRPLERAPGSRARDARGRARVRRADERESPATVSRAIGASRDSARARAGASGARASGRTPVMT